MERKVRVVGDCGSVFMSIGNCGSVSIIAALCSAGRVLMFYI